MSIFFSKTGGALGALVVTLSLAMGIASCNDTTTPAPNPGSTPAPSASAGANVVNVQIPQDAMTLDGDAFGTNPLVVPVGTTVHWTNGDSITHTITSDSGAFESGNLDPGKTFDHTFDTEGDFPYHCSIHPNMMGAISVMPSGSPSGSPSPSPSPSASASPEPSSSPSASPTMGY